MLGDGRPRSLARNAIRPAPLSPAYQAVRSLPEQAFSPKGYAFLSPIALTFFV